MDISSTLPWHPERTWEDRGNVQISNIIVHQTLSAGSINGVNNYHITPSVNNHVSQKGCPHICYHYVINTDGRIYKVNNLNSIVWHVKGHNNDSIGVMVLGNFEGRTWFPDPKSNPSRIQLIGLHKLLLFLKMIPKCKDSLIYGHGHIDLNKVNCPGLVLNAYLETLTPRGLFSLGERYITNYRR